MPFGLPAPLEAELPGNLLCGDLQQLVIDLAHTILYKGCLA